MLNLSGDKLREEFEESDLGDTLKYLLNPMNVAGSVVGGTEGIFGCQEWERYTASKLAALSAAVAVVEDDRTKGESLYQKVIGYVKLTVGEIPQGAVDIGDKASEQVSFCHNAATGKAAIWQELKKNGFFERLEPAYSTLEIITLMVIEDETSLPAKSIAELQKYLQSQVDEYKRQVAAGGEGRRFQVKQYQLNKYRALLTHLTKSYAQAEELLSGFDVQRLNQTIKDQKIRYRRLL